MLQDNQNERGKPVFHQDLLTIFVLAAAFGLMGFSYSLIDFTQPPHKVVALEPFRAITVQEIGGHFLFGFVAATVASRNLRIGILVGLMALSIDADHVLNVAKLPVQARLDHSVFFALLSAPLMGWLAVQIVNRKSTLLLPPGWLKNSGLVKHHNNNTQHKSSGNNNSSSLESKEGLIDKDNITSSTTLNQNPKDGSIITISTSSRFIFLQFSILTIAAILFHIAYDIAVDDNARFPLLNPFNFGWVSLPRISTIPIEATGFLIIYFHYYAHMRRCTSSSSSANTH